jgi:acyl carrier protein
MKTDEEITKEVVAICENFFCRADFKPETDLVKDAGMQDIGRIEIVMVLENEFDCDIVDNEAFEIHTIQDCINLVKKKLQEKGEYNDGKCSNAN